MKLSVLWIVFSIPVITLGGATIAVFDVTLRMVDDEEGYVAHQFVKAFKQNFKTGILYGVLLLLCCYAVWLDFSLFEQIEGNPIIFWNQTTMICGILLGPGCIMLTISGYAGYYFREI